MSNKIFQYLLIASVMVLPACWFGSESIPPLQKLQLVNLLDQELFNDCHITGSINVPFMQFEDYVAKLNKNTEVVVYCSDYQCLASGYAWQALHDAGFKNVWAYEGGMAEWYQAGLPVTGPAQQSYLKKNVAKPSTHSAVRVIELKELKEKLNISS